MGTVAASPHFLYINNSTGGDTMQYIDLVKEVQELLDREELSSYAIGKGANVNIESVRRLRNNTKPVDQIQLRTAQKLLNYKIELDNK